MLVEVLALDDADEVPGREAVQAGEGVFLEGAALAEQHAAQFVDQGAGAQVDAGSAVLGKVKAGHFVAGSPAERRGKAKHEWPETPATASVVARLWFVAFAFQHNRRCGTLFLVGMIADVALRMILFR